MLTSLADVVFPTPGGPLSKIAFVTRTRLPCTELCQFNSQSLSALILAAFPTICVTSFGLYLSTQSVRSYPVRERPDSPHFGRFDGSTVVNEKASVCFLELIQIGARMQK